MADTNAILEALCLLSQKCDASKTDHEQKLIEKCGRDDSEVHLEHSPDMLMVRTQFKDESGLQKKKKKKHKSMVS